MSICTKSRIFSAACRVTDVNSTPQSQRPLSSRTSTILP
jgi:hypothetical protein